MHEGGHRLSAVPDNDSPLLELRGIEKRFGAVRALAGVDFDVRAGEVVALAGDNGAGKSTLVKVITGVGPADAGTVAFDGRAVRIASPHDATTLGVAAVYQDLALCDNLDVVENLFLGREARRGGRRGPLDPITMEQRAGTLLASLSIGNLGDVRREVGTMSGGQRQSVAITRALLGDARLIVLDEPTAALGVVQTEQVLSLVRRLRDRGLGVVLVSHNLADVFAVADRIAVLRLGRNAGVFAADPARRSDVVAAITGVSGDLTPAAAGAISPAGASEDRE
jgi:D-xylose transport system ATP-binding protein